MLDIPTQDRSQALQTLQALTERLSAPDLTAAEARDLRPRLFRLLESLEPEPAARPNPARRCLTLH